MGRGSRLLDGLRSACSRRVAVSAWAALNRRPRPTRIPERPHAATGSPNSAGPAFFGPRRFIAALTTPMRSPDHVDTPGKYASHVASARRKRPMPFIPAAGESGDRSSRPRNPASGGRRPAGLTSAAQAPSAGVDDGLTAVAGRDAVVSWGEARRRGWPGERGGDESADRGPPRARHRTGSGGAKATARQKRSWKSHGESLP